MDYFTFLIQKMDLKKSSDEIITELFDSINTVNTSSDSSESENDFSKKKNKKDKKVKKAKKSKKSKKSKGEESSKSKHHKKKKKKRKKHRKKESTSDSDSDDDRKNKTRCSKLKIKEILEKIFVDNKEEAETSHNYIDSVPETNDFPAVDSNSEPSLIPLPPIEGLRLRENKIKNSELCETVSKTEEVNVNCLKVADVFVEDLIESGDQKAVKSLINPPDKPKMAIKISDLRKSTVLELAEEQAKLQADLHEDGEIIETSDSSRDTFSFKVIDHADKGGILVKSCSNANLAIERGVISSSQKESQSEHNDFKILAENNFCKEKRINEKLRKRSRERDKSKDRSPISKLKRQSLDLHARNDDETKEKNKLEHEKSRERRRSRDKKIVRRSMSGSRSKGGNYSRSKDRIGSRSKERNRSKSREKVKSRDFDKKCKEKKLPVHGETGREGDLFKYKHFIDKKNDISDDSKNHRRSKSKDKKRERSRSKESQKRKKDKKTPERRGRSRERHSKRSRFSRSRSRSKLKGEYFIDKSKLLEIARKNALNMLKQGQVNIGVNSGIAGNVSTASADVNKVAAITAGGKTVDELTDFCKLLSQKEATGQESISSESSSDNENERPFHHPFQLKERPNNIIMNIRNCASLPVKTHQEKTTENAQQLRLQFPVSSGQQHRKTESEWIPVSTKKNEPKAILPPPPVTKFETAEPPPLPVKAARDKIVHQFVTMPPPPPPPVYMEPSVLHTNNFELGNMISERLTEIRHQYETANQPFQQINNWPGMENQAGLFTGSTGARVLSAAELASGQQAWAKKDQLICAQPVCGGMGMSLLQKMGWKPGEGLGKHSEGSLEPLKLPVKMDKRGLVCAEELPRRQRIFPAPLPKDPPPVKSLEGKHPVSLLVEYCSRRHLPPPIFTVISEEGPAHKKNFVFKVTVNGTDFQPPNPSPNKKQAKSEAATLCLKKLNILPTV